MVTACFSMLLHLLLLLIRIAMKLRLSIPLVYLVLMLTVFQPWYRAHTALADGIFLLSLPKKQPSEYQIGRKKLHKFFEQGFCLKSIISQYLNQK